MKTLLSVLVMLTLVSCSRSLTKEELITQAIMDRRTLTITYEYPDEDAREVVEPHLFGTTTTNDEAVQVWVARRIPNSDKKLGWRIFLLKRIRTIELSEPFTEPRPGFDPSGGKTFTNVRVTL